MSKFEKTPLPSRQKKVRIEPKSRFIPTKIGESYIKAQFEENSERDVNHLVKFTKKE